MNKNLTFKQRKENGEYTGKFKNGELNSVTYPETRDSVQLKIFESQEEYKKIKSKRRKAIKGKMLRIVTKH